MSNDSPRRNRDTRAVITGGTQGLGLAVAAVVADMYRQRKRRA